MNKSMATRVCIVWRDGYMADGLHTLVYRPSHAIRTYERDALDPRIGDVVDVKSVAEVIEIARRADGTKMAVPLSVARSLGWKESEFAGG